MDSRENDLLLVDRVRAGDEAAFEAIVVRHQDRVYNICRYMLGPADADDAAQETFIKAYRNLSAFTPAPSFSAWITRIAVNTCLDYLRKRPHISINAAAPDGGEFVREEASRGPGPERELELKRAGLAITDAIGRLSEKLRPPIVLLEIEGLSYEEISAALGISVGTVKSRISRAREELKRLLCGAREQI